MNLRLSNKNINEYYYNQEYTKIKIVNGEIANTNEIGFLHISTPTISDRYLNDSIKTKKDDIMMKMEINGKIQMILLLKEKIIQLKF